MTARPEQDRALKRSMRVVGTLLLTLSSITPASSVFVIVPGVFQKAGTGAFLSMAVTAVVSLLVAYVYAELSSAYPIAGGEYSMVGRALGPVSGIATLGLIILGNMLAPAVLALGAADYLEPIIPGLNPVAVGIAIIVITTLFAILHIRTNAWVTGIFLALELLALAALAALGFLHVHVPLPELVLHPVMLTNNHLQPTPMAMLGQTAAVSLFAYNGYGSAVYFAEEMHEAPRLVARTIFWALVITVIAELVPVTAVLMGAADTKALLAADSPFGYFVQTTGGRVLNILVSLSIALAVINAVLATILQNGRFFFSTGRDGTWHRHINDGFTRTHPRYNSPWIATLVSGVTAAAMCFLGMNLLLVLTGTGLALIYAVLCVAVVMGRRNGRTAHAPYRMPLFPLAPVLSLLVLGFVLYTNWLDPQNGRPSLIANAAIIIASVAYYLLVLRRRGAWVLRDPVDHPEQGKAD